MRQQSFVNFEEFALFVGSHGRFGRRHGTEERNRLENNLDFRVGLDDFHQFGSQTFAVSAVEVKEFDNRNLGIFRSDERRAFVAAQIFPVCLVEFGNPLLRFNLFLLCSQFQSLADFSRIIHQVVFNCLIHILPGCRYGSRSFRTAYRRAQGYGNDNACDNRNQNGDNIIFLHISHP